jgi:hypothetical protein
MEITPQSVASVLIMVALAFIQNVSFSMVSRSRNHDHSGYHVVCAILSNGIWFATMQYLVVNQLTWALFAPYTIGTVSGSLTGSKISARVEKWLGLKKS